MQHANFVIGHLVIGHFVIGHLSRARSNLVKNRACQEPIRFENFVIVVIISEIRLHKKFAGI